LQKNLFSALWQSLPSPTCDPTIEKDLKRTPARDFLSSFSALPGTKGTVENH